MARLLTSLRPVPPPKDVPSLTRTKVILISSSKCKEALFFSSTTLEVTGGLPSKQRKNDSDKAFHSFVRLSMKRFREQMNQVIP